MDDIQPNLLRDTLSIVQLAREMARDRGSLKQAERMAPIIEKLLTLVNQEKETRPNTTSVGIMAQDDFQKMLQAARASENPQPQPVSDRRQAVIAMATGDMADIDIARQLGMTRDEVRTILNIANKDGRKE